MHEIAKLTPPKLTEKDIHVWLVQLSRFYSEINPPNAKLKALLSEKEQQRAARFLFDKHRYPYIVSQAYLRILLSQYLNLDPASLQFSFGPYGKPYLENCQLHFNISHSREYALYAFTLNKEVGIDIEFQRDRTHSEGIVASQFSALEYAQYQQIPASEQQESFYKGWSCKEAFIKGIGMGLAFPLRDFSVDMDPKKAAKLIEITGDIPINNDWHLHLIDAPKHYSSALATQLVEPAFKYFMVPSA